MNGKLSIVRPELHPILVKAPWYHLGIDFVGPVTPVSPSGKRYILTISDYCTKWVDAIATNDKSASETAHAIFKVTTQRIDVLSAQCYGFVYTNVAVLCITIMSAWLKKIGSNILQLQCSSTMDLYS